MIASSSSSRPQTPAGLPGAGAVMGRASSENFPVASRVLPRGVRAHLLAIYGFARLVDELGDTLTGDRLLALEWLQRELDEAYAKRATHPLMRRLEPTLDVCDLPPEPFLRLIEANRVDQHVKRYESWDQLLAYCDLSANPVGELVLRVMALATPERLQLANAICTGLQLAEHWQDVGEDWANGRVYLPAEDLERFGCELEDLSGSHANERLRRLIAFEVGRTRVLFDQGAPLVKELRGRAKLAVAAFLGGGRAALDAIERAHWDVLASTPSAGRGSRLLATGNALIWRAR